MREHDVIGGGRRAEERGHGRAVGRVKLGDLDRVADPLDAGSARALAAHLIAAGHAGSGPA